MKPINTAKDTKQLPNSKTAKPNVKTVYNEDTNETETFVIIPPDGGWGWAVLIGAFFCYFISDGLLYSFGLFLKDISSTFKCTQSKASLAGAISSCFFCLSGPFSAALVNRFGYRKIAIVGSIVASTACVLTSLSNSIYLVIICYGVIGGIGFGMIYITAVIVVGFYFDRWRALATGFAVCGAGIGGMSLPPIFAILIEKIGWQNTFRVLALMVLCIIFCGLLFRQIKPTRIVISKSVSPKQTELKSVNKYHNITYPKLTERKGSTSTVTILEPPKLQRNTSTEMAVTNYQTVSANASYRSDKYSDVLLNEHEHSIIYEENEVKERCSCYRCGQCMRKYRITGKKTRHKWNAERPMYKDDIFYSGSVMNLPEFKKSVQIVQAGSGSSKSKSAIEYNMSVTRIAAPEEKNERKCTICPLAIKRTIGTMLDFHLLKSPTFVLLILSGVFTSFGFYIPYMFIKDRGVLHKVPEKLAVWFISTMGLANTIGRICCGVLSSITGIKAIVLSYTLLFCGGTATILSSLSYKIWIQFFYCAVYGFSMSSMSALRTIVVVEMLGLEKLSNAVGMILMFQGLATLAGIALSGFFRDATGDYYYSFYFGGGCICIGAVLLIVVHVILIYQHKTKV